MEWIQTLQRAIDYIEENLTENITIADIAKQANVSMYHFQRIFMILTDVSVGEYIRSRRLTLAAQELTRGSCKVIDLAYKYGYETPEAFTKAFRKQHGVTPSEARRHSETLISYNRLIIQVSLKGAEPMKYKVVEREGFQVIGVKREFNSMNGENLIGIPKLWDEVNNDGTAESITKRINGQIRGLLGVCVAHDDIQSTGLMDYWIAAEYIGEVPSKYSVLQIPASKWIVFEVYGAMPDAMQKMWKKIFAEWFPTSGYEPAHLPELEVYTDDCPTSPDCYSEIWIPVK